MYAIFMCIYWCKVFPNKFAFSLLCSPHKSVLLFLLAALATFSMFEVINFPCIIMFNKDRKLNFEAELEIVIFKGQLFA